MAIGNIGILGGGGECITDACGAVGCCASFEDSGFPSSLTAGFALSQVGSAAPDDAAIGNCGTFPDLTDIMMRWQESPAFAAMLGTVPFDFVSSGNVLLGCGVCCFYYRSSGSVTPGCPGGTYTNSFEMGANPFPAKAFGGTVYSTIIVGPNASCPDTLLDSPCITHAHDQRNCPDTWHVEDGTLYAPSTVFGEADMYICLSGNTVHVCVTVTITVICDTYTGDFDYSTPWIYGLSSGGEDAECLCLSGPGATGTYTTSCETSGGTITINTSADLTDVEGATLWDKIQNATEWTGTYAYGICSCAGGGCVGGWVEDLSTFCVTGMPDDGDEEGIEGCETNCLVNAEETNSEDNHPVDQICYYSSGTASVSLAAV